MGVPVQADLFAAAGEKPGASAPDYVVEAALLTEIDAKYIAEDIMLIDFGEAFWVPSPSPMGLGTPASYRSPELITDSKASKASDIWALACTIFEMRAGFPLFESFLGSDFEVLREMIRILGRPPDCSHSLWRKAARNDIVQASSLEERVREIGMYDHEIRDAKVEDGSFCQRALLEPAGERVGEEEVQKLANLLRRALRFSPDERASAKELANHSWFAYNDKAKMPLN